MGERGVLRELMGGGEVRIRMMRDKDTGKRGEECSKEMGGQKEVREMKRGEGKNREVRGIKR